MLLRRVMENVKDQNWFAVLLDFFIVIFGILIAFQLQAWGERRAAAARADQSLHQLYEESEVILAHWTGTVRAYDLDIEQQDQVVAALAATDESMRRHGAEVTIETAARTGIQELVAAGV